MSGTSGGIGAAPPAAGSVRYFAWLYAGVRQRASVAALLALEQEIATSACPGLDHAVAHLRLEWWRGECERIAAGEPFHPLGRELGAAQAAARGTPLALAGLVENAALDLAGATFEERRELEAYCARWAEAIAVTLARAALGETEVPAVRALGAAIREIELLEVLAGDARLGRLRVPLDELDRLQVDPRALAAPPWPPPLAAHLRERLVALQEALAAALGRFTTSERAALRPLLVWARLAARHAARAAAALPHPPPARRRDALADSLAAWRAALHAGVAQP